MTRISLARVALVCIAFGGTSAGLAQTFDLSWYTIDGGGAMFTMGAGGLELSGTIGQFDAGSAAAPMTGGTFELVGGFWAVAAEVPCPGARGDADCSGTVDFFDIDPFLMALFNLPGYLGAYCDGSICAVDTDCSGAVDFFDIDPFLSCVFGSCPPCP